MADDGSPITVSVPAHLADAVSRAVESGDYESPADVVGEALEEWRLRRPLTDREREAIAALWDEGIASGPSRFGSMDEIKAEARRRWMANKTI